MPVPPVRHRRPVATPEHERPSKTTPSSRETFERMREYAERNPKPRFGGLASKRVAADAVALGPLTHAERIVRDVRAGIRPLRVVFCNHYGSQADNTFRANATRMARTIDAVTTTNNGLDLGATTILSRNIAGPLRVISERTGQPVAEIHIFGHVGHGVERTRAWAREIKPFVRPDVKVVLHGCYQAASAEYLHQTLLAELPNATVYGHWTGSESGMPYQFARIDRNGVTKLDDVTPEVLPNAYRNGWLDAQASNGAGHLRALLTSPGMDDELRREIEHRLDARRNDDAK